jgi:arsenite methyltransferase
LSANKNTLSRRYRILKDGGRIIISDKNSVNVEKWCSCIDGALTKENYLDSIRKAGFNNLQVLQEAAYLEDKTDKRMMTSLVVKAIGR